jgi:dTDP-4-dehydrorhamnose 3,5-epimerase
MKFIKTAIADVYVLEPSVFEDERGYFSESFNLQKFEENIGPVKFIQDNESKSSKGVLRGLHFQKPPFNQAKLVRCMEGRVLDVSVDIRKGSPTYGKHVAVELSGENKKQVFISRGFAHGFVVLSESAVFAYKVDNRYAPEYDAGIRFDDEALQIDWRLPQEEVQLSEKDKNLPSFKDLDPPFKFSKHEHIGYGI